MVRIDSIRSFLNLREDQQSDILRGLKMKERLFTFLENRQTKEVKELVAYTRDQHAKYGRLLNEFRTKVNTVTDVIFNSELCVIGGTCHKDALTKIGEII